MAFAERLSRPATAKLGWKSFAFWGNSSRPKNWKARKAQERGLVRNSADCATDDELREIYAESAKGFPFAKFWRSVNRDSGVGSCWLWNGGVNSYGYGYSVAALCGSNRVHRIALAIKLKRAIRPGAEVLHACDVRSCCNPDHLSEGTHAENMRGMVERGRSTKGQTLPQRKNKTDERGERRRCGACGKRGHNARTCLASAPHPATPSGEEQS
jgi:hypothetical protein